tara:strand:- start:1463 stop:5632 length:4170 start_codon:yes stop_codon:yes gene_type:complete
MRIDNLEFQEKNKARHQEPIYVVEISFDLANTDIHYITSHTVSGLTGSISNKALKLVSSSTQKLDPDKAHSTIGTIRFEAMDVGLTDLMRTKLNENKGLRNKRVRIHKGHRGLSWSKFTLFNTYVVDNNISYLDGVYTFNCGDIQRSMKSKIFIETKTAIMAPVSATDTTISVLDASKFNLVYQVPSATGKTLLRGLQQRVYPVGHANAGDPVYPDLAGIDHIGLIRIPGEDHDEIAMFTGKAGNTLTGLVRGVLGTRAVDVEVESGITIDDAPQISEYVYINMPAVKAAYALLTGSIYGAPGEFLPDHWHLGISTDYIQTSSFINIGSDLWDLTDDDKGFPVVIKGRKDIEAKKFIEQNIYYMTGLYPPINSQGEITLKRMQYIGPNGSYVRLLDESNIVDYTAVDYDQAAIRNAYIIKWNYDDAKEKYTRTSTLLDTISKVRHQKTDVKIIELDTLHGSRHSDASIKYQFDALRSRYAGPPLKRGATLTPDQDDLEVGDIVRYFRKNDEDYTNDADADGRNYEVQQLSLDTKTGRVKVSLFASSQKASDVVPENPVTASDTFLSSEGTEINATNFPSAGITSSGGVTTITGNLTLTGHADLNNSAAIFYVDEDFTIDASAVITVVNNVQLRVNGFLQINGLIDGKGNGLAGGVSDSVVAHIEAPVTANLGVAGVGRTVAQGGFLAQFDKNGPSMYATLNSFNNRIVESVLDSVASINITLDSSGTLNGLPSSLMGSGGSSGGGAYYSGAGGFFSAPQTLPVAKGGSGGSGGAGLVIFHKGSAIGAAGEIDLSGGDAEQGEILTYPAETIFILLPAKDIVRGGSGAGGAPGGLILLSLDSNQTFFSGSQTDTVLNYGASAENERLGRWVTLYRDKRIDEDYRTDQGFRQEVPISSAIGGGVAPKAAENMWTSFSSVKFLDTSASPVIDPPPYVEPIPTFTLTEQLNTPVTPKGDRSSIEVSVTPPIFGAGEIDNYSYSLVEYRVSGDDLWIAAKPASHESVIEVPTNGQTYQVRIRAVSTKKLANDTGPIQSITVTNVLGATDIFLAGVYPFSALGLSVDNVDGAKFKYGTARLSWDHDNSELNYFNHYEITVSNATDGVLRTEIAAASNYEYSLAKNREDYTANNAMEGIYDEVTFSVRAVSKIKNVLDILYKGTAETSTVDRVPPPNVASFSFADGVLKWTVENMPLDLAGFEIRVALESGDEWEDASPVTGGIITTTSYYLGTAPTSGTVFFIKSKDLSGNYSVGATELEIGGAAPTGSIAITGEFKNFIDGAGSSEKEDQASDYVTLSTNRPNIAVSKVSTVWTTSAHTTFSHFHILFNDPDMELTSSSFDSVTIDGINLGAPSLVVRNSGALENYIIFIYPSPTSTPSHWVQGTTKSVVITGV